MSADKSNKTVFLMCKEHYSYPMFLMARMIQERGFCPVLVFVHNTETLLKTHSYQVYQKYYSDIECIDFGQTYRDFVSSPSAVGAEYSEKLSEELKSLSAENDYWRIRASSQLLSSTDHYRFYFADERTEEADRWIYFHLRKVREVFEAYSPSVILDIDNSELVRTLFYVVGKSRNCPYRTLESTRLEDLWVVNSHLGRRNDADLTQQIAAQEPDPEDFEKYDNYLNEHHKSVQDYKKHGVIAQSNKPLKSDLALLFGRLARLTRKHVKHYPLLGFFRRPRFMAGGLHSLSFFILYALRRRYLLSRHNRLFKTVEEQDKYFYFPLHLIPESTTSIKVPLFLNELEILHIISRSLPCGMTLIVKEHGAMIGERPLSFYREVNKLPNAKMVRLDQFPSSLEWILRSKGVITLTGTTALEAALSGKPSIMVGETVFVNIDGIERLRDLDSLPEILTRYSMEKTLDNRLPAARYIKYCRTYGLKWPMHTILFESKKVSSAGHRAEGDLQTYLSHYIEAMLEDV